MNTTGREFSVTLARENWVTLDIYALRHSFATLLLADGEELLVVSRLLGHKSIVLTADIYSGVLPERRQEATKRFDAMFGTA